MTAEVGIRRAVPEDAGDLARLRYEFRTETASANEGREAFFRRAEAWFATRLADPSWLGWVAVCEKLMVGHVFVHMIEKVPNPTLEEESLGYLTNLYVRPAYRRQGIGGELVESARSACAVAGTETIFLRPSAAGMALYRRCGFGSASFLERQPF
jgi:GNAT superfamily N-acetyltransferase